MVCIGVKDTVVVNETQLNEGVLSWVISVDETQEDPGGVMIGCVVVATKLSQLNEGVLSLVISVDETQVDPDGVMIGSVVVATKLAQLKLGPPLSLTSTVLTQVEPDGAENDRVVIGGDVCVVGVAVGPPVVKVLMILEQTGPCLRKSRAIALGDTYSHSLPVGSPC